MSPRVLVSDALSPAALRALRLARRRGRFPARPRQGRLRSSPPPSAPMTGSPFARRRGRRSAARAGTSRLKVIGRAGVGVDNVDVAAATARGVDRDEHALWQFHHHRRAYDRADAGARPTDSRRRRLHPRRQMGEEPLHGRRARRQDARHHRLRQCRRQCRDAGARSRHARHRLSIRFSRAERAETLGVEPVALDALLQRADIVTLHTPLTAQDAQYSRTREPRAHESAACASSIARAAGSSTRPRSLAALDAGHVAGAALDVFETEPRASNPLFSRAECRLHAASRRLDDRGAGEGRGADRRTHLSIF